MSNAPSSQPVREGSNPERELMPFADAKKYVLGMIGQHSGWNDTNQLQTRLDTVNGHFGYTDDVFNKSHSVDNIHLLAGVRLDMPDELGRRERTVLIGLARITDGEGNTTKAWRVFLDEGGTNDENNMHLRRMRYDPVAALKEQAHAEALRKSEQAEKEYRASLRNPHASGGMS